MTVSISVEERFWSKVNKTGDCWLWLSGCFPNGYGKFRLFGKFKKAHRVAWEFTNGPIPERLIVCHHCDNPRCVRPDHLFLGTNADNSSDMVRKGRQARGDLHGSHLKPESLRRGDEHWIRRLKPDWVLGTNNPKAKLTEDNVRSIRQRLREPNPQLATEFGVSDKAISHIRHGRTWKHVL